MEFWNIYCTYAVIVVLGSALMILCEGYANKHKHKDKDKKD